jgi:hypothetical protein
MNYRKVSTISAATFLMLLGGSTPVFAASTVTTIKVSVARFLSITNTSLLEFGTVSPSTTAGTVLVNSDGSRFASGGVTIDPAGLFTPAKFQIEGKPDSEFSVKLPSKVVLRDGSGNTIDVDNFQIDTKLGQLNSNGTLELSIGGQINLDPNQSAGDYSGTMVVELNYS